MSVDKKIVKDCIAGKRKAQSKLYQKYSGVLLGLCMRYTINSAEAEDILQEGFIKIFNNIKTLRNIDVIEGWMKRIMVNTAISHFKKKKIIFQEISEYQMENHLSNDMDSDDLYAPVEPEFLMKLIRELPGGYKVVLNLYIFDGYSHKEIAEELGISVNTSKSQLSKAKNHIRKRLAQLGLIHNKTLTNETIV